MYSGTGVLLLVENRLRQVIGDVMWEAPSCATTRN
jgi:hypothetical protein